MLALDLSPLPPGVRLGTSSFSAADWTGLVYPPGTRPGDYLVHYARLFPTVEIDATFYAVPSRPTVAGWTAKTPDGFTFSLKVPREITHERGLVDCREEWRRFLAALEPLGRKRGPLLFQFPYMARQADPREYETGDGFCARLAAFLPQLPADARAVVEVRNAKWLAPPLLDLLRERGVALALTAYYTMPGLAELLRGPDPLTGPFAYVRFLGDHRRMDALVAQARRERGKQREWDELLVDKQAELRGWVNALRAWAARGFEIYAYVNNHYAGCAPLTAAQIVAMWAGREPGDPESAA